MKALTGLKRISASVKQRNRRDVIQQNLMAYKGGRCERCAFRGHPNTYDFHHGNPMRKEFVLDRSNFGRRISSLLAEVDKCYLLCAICHREVHTYQDRQFLVCPDSLSIEEAIESYRYAKRNRNQEEQEAYTATAVGFWMPEAIPEEECGDFD